MARVYDSFRVRCHGDQCIYCGLPETSDEHFPPVSASGKTGSGFIFPSCTECNVIAGVIWPLDFILRAKHVKSRLAKRYRRILANPDWRPDELDEMSPKFKKEFEACQKLKIETQNRIAWSAANYLCLIADFNVFAEVSAKTNGSDGSDPIWLDELRNVTKVYDL